MSLKSIRESYVGLLNAFTEAGVKLNESQKASLDTFVVALESKMNKQKEATVKATKKVVTEHLDKQYQKVFESIMQHQAEHAELAGKIQTKIKTINESKKIARKVDNYLDLYVESVLPKKAIVDYDRMQKLERLHESLKDLLTVNQDAVEAKKAELTESFNRDKKELETQIAKLQVKLNESMSKSQKLSKQIDQTKAKTLLESKLANVPSFEAKQIRQRLDGATCAEIEHKFKKVFESVKAEVKEEAENDETSLEEEISNIIEKEEQKSAKKCDEKECCDEDDILKGRKHNGHLNEDDDELEEVDDELEEADKVELDESEKIDRNLMAYWCEKVGSIETKGY